MGVGQGNTDRRQSMSNQERVQIIAGTSLDWLQTTMKMKIDILDPYVRFQPLAEVDASFLNDMLTQPAFRWPEHDRAIETASADAGRAKAGPNAGHKTISAIVRDASGSKFLMGYRLENFPARPALSDLDREGERRLMLPELSDLDRKIARHRTIMDAIRHAILHRIDSEIM